MASHDTDTTSPRPVSGCAAPIPRGCGPTWFADATPMEVAIARNAEAIDGEIEAAEGLLTDDEQGGLHGAGSLWGWW